MKVPLCRNSGISNFDMHMNCLRILLKCRWCFRRIEVGPDIWITSVFPGDAVAFHAWIAYGTARLQFSSLSLIKGHSLVSLVGRKHPLITWQAGNLGEREHITFILSLPNPTSCQGRNAQKGRGELAVGLSGLWTERRRMAWAHGGRDQLVQECT